MQVGVIGGVCLLACLLSLGHSEELDDSKQAEESETSEQKELESSIESGRRSFNGVENSKETSSDLKTVDNVTDNILKSSSEIQNASQNTADPSTSKESLKFNQSSTDSLEQLQSPSLLKPVNSKSATYFMDSRFNTDNGLPDGGSYDGPALNTYYNNMPLIKQGFVAGSAPSISSLQTPTTNGGASQESRYSHELTTAKIQEDTATMKSFERTLIINTNKVLNKLPTLSANIGEGLQGQQGARFSPLFSSEYAHNPVSEYQDLPNQARANLKAESLPNRQSYSYDSKASFDDTRRESNKDDIQVRNVDQSQYSEAMNAYPYAPLSDSSSKERSGDPSYLYHKPEAASAQAYAMAQVQNDDLTTHNQGLNPYSFGYPRPASGSSSLALASATAQFSPKGPTLAGGKSRVIWPHEYIFPNKLPDGENVIQCSRENELHHFWSQTYDCLVCICLNEYGLLQPVCASCSGCQKPALPEPPPNMPQPVPPTNEPYVPLPVSVSEPYVPVPTSNFDPFTPSASAPSLIVEPVIELESTTIVPLREVPVSCDPLPSGQPFNHPLNPCQMCLCKVSINALGKTEVRIECQENYQCVLPPDTTTIPPLPDNPTPVPLPLCEKFPSHVSFPHPKESCKVCQCSVEPSDLGVPEQKITCFQNSTDINCSVAKSEPPTELITPPAPPIPIPVEPYPGPPLPNSLVEPLLENFPPTQSPTAGTPIEPLPWPPISTTAPPPLPFLPKKGPLPGPSPHDSCRPYPPNQPFQHPWDDCQVCECAETKAVGMVNVEISCYTKLSCCIESPEHAISEAGAGLNGEHDHVLAVVNAPLTSTMKPAYGSGIRQYPNQSAPIAIVNKPIYQVPPPYQSPNVIGSGRPTSAEVNFEQKPQAFHSPAISPNQEYVEATAIAQNTQNNPAYPVPGSYQSVNAYGSAVNSVSQSLADSNADYNIIPGGINNFGPSLAPGVSQSQVYAEANAIAQKPASNPTYEAPGGYPLSVQAQGSVNNGPQSSEASEEYLPLSVTYKPAPVYPQYNLGISPSQTYGDANAQYNRPVSTTYKPPSMYSQYRPDLSSNQAYAEAVAQYKDLVANTQKPPVLYGQYNPAMSQNQGQPNAQYSNFITSTFKPPALYNPYHQESLQNQAYAQANAQYNLVTSTPRPATLYGQYGPGVPRSPVYPSANAVYTGSLTVTEKPLPKFNPYGAGIGQNQAYTGGNAQNSKANTGYYLPGYQTPKASGSSSDQSSIIAEAMAQSQDYSPYPLAGNQIGGNSISKPSSAYPYQSYYSSYLSPQYPSYSGRTDKGMEGYKANQVQYAGNYEFNGQPDSISILNSQTGYYPYGSGYSQAKPASSMYSGLYPTQNNYEISPIYRPGQYGGTIAQSVAQAYAVKNTQSKSGESHPEDVEDSK